MLSRIINNTEPDENGYGVAAIKNAQDVLEDDTYVVIANTSLKTRMIMDEFAPNAKPVFFSKGIKKL